MHATVKAGSIMNYSNKLLQLYFQSELIALEHISRSELIWKLI